MSMAINSPSKMEPLLVTGFLILVVSPSGWYITEPAPHGPGNGSKFAN